MTVNLAKTAEPLDVVWEQTHVGLWAQESIIRWAGHRRHLTNTMD